MRAWSQLPLFADQPQRLKDEINVDRRRNSPAGLAAALQGLGTGAMIPLWDRLGELTIPVTLIVGENDSKFRAIAEKMSAALNEARIAVAPGAGHAVHLEDPEFVSRRLV